MQKIEMKVNPSFVDEQLSIAFFFEFLLLGKKIGEALVYTYAEHDSNICDLEEGRVALRKNKYARVHEFQVFDEYHEETSSQLSRFLQVIGIEQVEYQIYKAI